jgi:hypothetical protein
MFVIPMRSFQYSLAVHTDAAWKRMNSGKRMNLCLQLGDRKGYCGHTSLMMGKLSLFGSISQTCLKDLWGRRLRKSIIGCVGDI